MAEANHEFAPDAEPEEPPSAMSRLCTFLYNRENGTYMGRTPGSWGKIGIFYLIYYSCLAAFFLGMLSVFLYGIIANEMPHRTGLNSLLNMNPGLGFRPHIDTSDTLIEFTAGKRDTYAKYIANLQHLYDSYKELLDKPEAVNVRKACGPDDAPDNEPTKVCKFNWTSELSGCLPQQDFGYASGKPCVIVKLNRIYGWLPDPIDQGAPHALVECRGENPADTENIGKISYFPSIQSNFTGNYRDYGYYNQAFYPYLKQVGYKAPLVAIKFNNLRNNTLVMVECIVRNLRNSQYSKVDRDGMVRFELYMMS